MSPETLYYFQETLRYLSLSLIIASWFYLPLYFLIEYADRKREEKND